MGTELLKTLILTEKPSVARDFASALNVRGQRDGYLEGDDYIITWAVGHLVELLEPEDYDTRWKKWNLGELPIIPEQFKYKPIPRTEKQLGVIKRLLTKTPIDKIVIATDAGREGEVIARTILLFSDVKDDKTLERFWTSQALTPQVVREGIAALKPASEYDRLWKAGQCRQIADWLVGMNGSRAATIRMNGLFTVGRVQTAVLSLLVDRRRERENFKPKPYWLLRAFFSNDKGNWWGAWFKADQTRLNTEKEAVRLQEKIAEQTGTVLSVKKQKKKQPPPPLYSLTDLQQEANKKFGLSAEQTLNIAQGLYENKKCLSYPRTDSKVLGSKNVSMIQGIVKKLSQSFPKPFAGVDLKLIRKSNKRVFNDAKLTDHHALIPLAPLPKSAGPDEMKIYDLVLKRFAAAFHPDCEYEQTEILTQVEKEKFRTKGKVILRPGWQVVYEAEDRGKGAEVRGKKGEESEEYLPPLKKGDAANVADTKIEKKKTFPPPEYSEALLLKDMTNPGRYVAEDELKKIYRGDVGLGTQATRAQIIETLLTRRYMERKKKHIIATDKGCRLIETLRQFNIAKILASPEETARWEMQLNEISRGKGSDKKFLEGIKNIVEETVTEFKNPDARFETPNAGFGKCPNCGGEIIKGKKDYGCSNWKKEDGACRFVIRSRIAGRIITPPIISTLLAKKQVGPLNGFVSEDGEEFPAIIRLVEQENKWQVGPPEISDSPQNLSENALGECPACGGEVAEGPKGYGCANWKTEDGGCRFTVWKNMARKEITPQIAVQLLCRGEAGPFDDFLSKDDKPFSTRIKLVQRGGDWKAEFDFPDRVTIGKCPVCGGDVVEGPKAYGCANWRENDGGCKFTIWKTISQREITQKNAIQILQQGITDILFGFISKKGNAFSTRLKLQPDESGVPKVVFDFSDDNWG